MNGSPEDSREHMQAERDNKSSKFELQEQVGGQEAWEILFDDISKCHRYAYEDSSTKAMRDSPK